MKSIGKQIFSVSELGRAAPKAHYERVLARDLQLKETWFRDAIYDNPELVIAPCRSVGQVDQNEAWLAWGIETNFGSGPIDVLLVSSYGRIGLVETKLSYNPQKRREVVAQILDYALSLQDVDRDDLPDLPASDFSPEEDDLADALASGKFLLIIAGDELDPRAIKLSQALLARHLTNEWDLAMVDLNVFRENGSSSLLVVPEVLGTIRADVRQVVRVKVEGENPKAKIQVEHISEVEISTGRARMRHLASAAAFTEETSKRSPELSGLLDRLISVFQRESQASAGRISFELGVDSINLYWVPSGRKSYRFLSLKTDGRFIAIFRYVEIEGSTDLSLSIEEICRPILRVRGNGRSAETMIERRNVDDLAILVKKFCSLLMHG